MKSFRLFLWLSVLTGVVYPLLIILIGQTVFPYQANGSLVEVEGKIVGSELLGQQFKGDKYFWGRPSASDYKALPSNGSNLGPISEKLQKLVEERKKIALTEDKNRPIPPEFLFSSGSGLDPHISPEGALFQLERIMRARGLTGEDNLNKLKQLIETHTTGRSLGIFGPPCVNVLLLNLSLDQWEKNHG